jgi:hypothetical protein
MFVTPRSLARRLAAPLVLLVVFMWLSRSIAIDPDEQVAFYSPYLHRSEAGELRLVLRGRLYEAERDSGKRRAAIDRLIVPGLFRYMGKRPSEFDEAARMLMYERLQPFLYDGESRSSIAVRVRGAGGEATIRLPRTDMGGSFALATESAGDRSIAAIVGSASELTIEAVMPASDTRRFTTRAAVPPRRMPLLVISDVDDAVRIADVTHKPTLVERTFLRPYEPVAGMSELYRRLADRGAWFHYVSGSPWQVAPLIEQFLSDAQFPASVMHCRQISWDFWNSDPLDTKEFKVATIRTLLAQFPDCPVLLIGDSGEQDPEVYSEISHSHADRLAGVWIRRVAGEWDAARLSSAVVYLGPERVAVFDTPDELDSRLQQLPRE